MFIDLLMINTMHVVRRKVEISYVGLGLTECMMSQILIGTRLCSNLVSDGSLTREYEGTSCCSTGLGPNWVAIPLR